MQADLNPTSHTANDLAMSVAVGLAQVPEVVVKVRGILESCKKPDAYNNCYFNLADVPNFNQKAELKAVKRILPEIVEDMRRQHKHMVCLKLSESQARIVKYARECGFVFHNANPREMLMMRCLDGHRDNECSYPKFMTVSVGVTGVVFDETLEKVLLVQEKWGVNKKLKPPTGTVDYLKGNDDPLSAVVRELKEETNLDVNPASAVLVGTTYSANFRGNSPDINYVFAFRVSLAVNLKAQEEEISQLGWKAFGEYTAEGPEEAQKPWVMKRIVAAARQALEHHREWKPQTFYWTSGKPVTLISASSH